MKRHAGERGHRPALMVLKCAVWLALAALVVALVLMLWNWLMPALFNGARAIDYWQALGLIVLCRVLFGGGHGRWGGRHGHRGHQRGHAHGHDISADERERFKRRFMGRCGAPSAGGEENGEENGAVDGSTKGTA